MAQKLKFENVKIMFKNFAGAPTPVNKKGGVRDFAIVLNTCPEEQIKQLIEMGIRVKYLNKKNETDPDVPFIKVKVNFRYNDAGDFMGPNIYLINGKEKKLIKPETAMILDSADIAYCDILVNPHYYEVNGSSGITTYLDTMYVILNVDPFADKYDMYVDPDEENAEPIPFE